jgi:hypothetical protein
MMHRILQSEGMALRCREDELRVDVGMDQSARPLQLLPLASPTTLPPPHTHTHTVTRRPHPTQAVRTHTCMHPAGQSVDCANHSLMCWTCPPCPHPWHHV